PSEGSDAIYFFFFSMLRRSRNLFLQWLSLFITASLFCNLSNGDVGTAAQYAPPYLPNACYGNDASQFPPNNYFAAAGDGIWDNGAACGRQYKVRCISAAEPKICVPGQTIQVKIVDSALSSSSRPSANGATIVLSTTAFQAIAKSSASSVNVEFQQYGVKSKRMEGLGGFGGEELNVNLLDSTFLKSFVDDKVFEAML
ncbi:RlpA-like protein, double-psi beta-barrel domain, partial [Dillenia turbinata]